MDFYYVDTGSSIKGPPPRNYNSTLGVHNSTLKHKPLHKRWALSKERNTLGDPMITNSLGDLKGSQIIFLTIQRS